LGPWLNSIRLANSVSSKLKTVEIYFHRNSVLGGEFPPEGFNSRVTYAEEMGRRLAGEHRQTDRKT
jgi:hypothetical protein